MADQIGVEIVAQDAQFIASTQKASAAMAALAAQEEKLGKVAADSGLDQKKFSQQFGKVESARLAEEKKAQQAKMTAEKTAQKAAVAAAKKAADDREKAESKAAAAALRDETKREAKSRQLARVLLGRKALILGEASGIGKAGVAAVELGGSLIVAGTAAAALLATIGVLAIKTAEAKGNAKEFLDVLTAGRGSQALELVDGLAEQLGIKIETARTQFEKFRQAGLDNKQSANLIKLAADLNAVDRSGELAEQAITRVLSYASDKPQTAEYAAAAGKAMALLAKQAGVAGDGTTAAADAGKSLAGAFNKLDNTKTKALEELGDKITPGLERAAQSLANIADDLLKSKEGQKIIDDIAASIIKMSDAAEKAGPYIENLVKTGKIQQGFDALGMLKDAVYEVGQAAYEIPYAFYAVGRDIWNALSWVSDKIKGWYQTIFIDADWSGAGKAIVDGIGNGIKNGASALLGSVEKLAGDIAESFAKKLHIHSPSKVFEGFGENTGEGYDRGVERSMPTGEEIAERAIPNPSVFSRQPAPIFGGAAPSSGGTRDVHVTVENITVPAGEDAGKWMRAAGHEFGLSIQAVLLSQGAPLP